MRADGVLTTVDIETEHQRLAKQGFSDAGVPANRARTIPCAALDVLPRLTDGHYDLVFCDGDKREYADYLKEALRLLRPHLQSTRLNSSHQCAYRMPSSTCKHKFRDSFTHSSS